MCEIPCVYPLAFTQVPTLAGIILFIAVAAAIFVVVKYTSLLQASTLNHGIHMTICIHTYKNTYTKYIHLTLTSHPLHISCVHLHL